MNKIFKTKLPLASAAIYCALLSLITFFAACKKEQVANSENISAPGSAFSGDISEARIIDKLPGSYAVTGTRTLYIGSASDSVVNLVVDLAPFSPKAMTSPDARTLLCDYADLGYNGGIPLGFQYVITFYPKKKTFDVQPNDIMTSLIVPGSWIVYEKTFNPVSKQFHFITKYSNASSGYDRIVDETLTWQSK